MEEEFVMALMESLKVLRILLPHPAQSIRDQSWHLLRQNRSNEKEFLIPPWNKSQII